MEIPTAVAGKTAEFAVGPVIRQGGYIIHCKSNLHALQTRVDELKATRGRVQNEIDAAKRRGENIHPDVEHWTKKVDENTGKAEELLNDDRAKMKCLLGFCPNLLTRHQLSRKSIKLLEVVVELNGKGVFPSISCGGPAEEVFLMSTKDYEAFESRDLTIKGIIHELSNPDTNKIGVYGIGGVGKTTLLEEVIRRVMEDKLFDDVVMVRDVKENPDIGRIQKEIAEKLDMDSNALESRSIADKARRICGRISNKNTLIVLDDIWSYVELKAVGLPDVSTCKVLLTSRIQEVLSSKMGTQKNFQLVNLEENECWQLFESKAGEVVKDQRIRTIAAQVANRCGGLPILVVTVASALKESTLPEWRNALKRLKKFEKEGSAEQAFLALEWSYDRLDDEGLKPLFLLCGVIARNNSIWLEDLLKLAMGLGLLKNVDTVEEARDLLLSLVKKLKGFCLLLDTNSDTAVRMHDLVIDVADNIASRDGRFLSVACGAELKNWTDEVLFGKCSKISIKSSSLPKLSEALQCQKLEMFHLRCEDEHQLQVPNSFFANMEKLKVLSLINVKNLACLGFLKNLQALCLDRCEMEDIAVVGELRKLEILSLGYTNIKQLPKEIGELTCLRLLDLTSCFFLQVIAPNVLSRLTRLEDLRVRNSSIKWEAEQEGERSNASLSELKHLSLLTALEINISNPGMLPKDLFSDKLERFYIRIGDHYSEGRSMNTLKLQFTTGDELDQGLKMLVKGSEYLTLQGGANVNEIAYRLEGDNFRQLKHLQLRNLDTTYIINSKDVISSLTTLEVTDCDGIKFLFSSSMARSLVQLRTLNISGCTNMVEIVSTQENDKENNIVNMFSKLESLTLEELPSLVRFCLGSYAEFSALEEVLISNGQGKSTTITKEIEDGDSKDHLGVDNAVRYFLFDEKVTFPSLEILRLEKLPKLEAVWQNQLAPDSFCRIREVRVDSCPSLINLFVPFITERLDVLKTLMVWSCPSLEVVFKCGGLKFKETHNPSTKELKTFNCCPNLEYFDIRHSDKLKYIFQKEERLETAREFVFPKVTELQLCNLPQFKSIYPGTHVSQWSSLQELDVDECGEVKIIAGELSVSQEKQESASHSNPIEQPLILIEKVVFSSLTTLNVAECHGIKFLFSSSMAKSLVQLKTLEIRNCRSMVVIVSTQEDDEENNIVNMFSRLESLTLKELPNLVGFYSRSYAGFSSLEEALISNGQSKSTTITKEIEDGDSKDHLGVDNAVRYLLFDEKVTFPSLEILRFEKLPKLEAVWQNQLAPDSFCRIREVRVDSCPSLINLFVPFITERLDALKTLRVSSCPSLEVVFKCGGLKFKETHDPSTKELKNFNCCPNLEYFSIQRSDKLKYICQTEERLEMVPKFVFPKVTELQLCNLPQFKSIYPGTHVSQWPSLQKLNVDECGEVKIIAGELSVYQEKQEFASHSNPIEQPLILIEKFVFSSLTTLEVTDCDGIKFLFSSSMARSLIQLKTLTISRCRSMVVIVSTQEDDEENNIVNMFSKLESLTLRELPSLVGFCSGSYVGFSSLEEALISNGQSKSTTITKEIEDGDSKDHLGVDNVVHYFLFDEKVTFPSLEILRLAKLPKLETEEQLEMVPKFVFPKVTELQLCNMPQFRSIYPGTHVSQWSSLQKLNVDECGEVKIIAGELSVYQEKQESASHSNPIEQPLILIEKGSSLFPSLETLTLGAMEMWSGPPPAQVCSKVKLVEVRGATFCKHAAFLQGLHNLEKLIVMDMGDKDPCREIFVDAGNGGGEIQVKKLTISDMDELMHIGKESSQSAVPVFPKLEKLWVWWCSRLKNLDSSTISFQNLTSLTVDHLDGLKYLVSHRIARSLMQLTRLKIRYCKIMEVIVATEEDVDELAFSQLKHLQLSGVPHLRGLCSGNCILKFPSLETLSISRRLKSKLFSHDEFRCKIDDDTYDTDVEDAPADDEDGGDDNEVNDDGHGNDKKDDEDSACDA
ncbi:uncharacterized protein LOC112190808 isoform X2 [Rosa chinensis]|uniref:uncharacterized protein LOC112190808 isoform X2 n=1 Tax=Rosa chinensis TaxID=74649 RepID=UPI000D08E572|nr:uncharacterized protein LOC112190808 isoform X2 [Rosa chinensis]